MFNLKSGRVPDISVLNIPKTRYPARPANDLILCPDTGYKNLGYRAGPDIRVYPISIGQKTSFIIFLNIFVYSSQSAINDFQRQTHGQIDSQISCPVQVLSFSAIKRSRFFPFFYFLLRLVYHFKFSLSRLKLDNKQSRTIQLFYITELLQQ